MGARASDEASVELHAARQDPYLMSEQLRAAWEALIDAETAARPLLVVLEDLHWADPASVRAFQRAFASLHRRPWMVLALARPDVHDAFPRLWEEHNLQEIRLAPLPRRACEKLVRKALGEVPHETVARLVAKAEGNAFYLEELIRAVAAQEGAGGARVLKLPETVLAMVQARLEGLDPEARRVLRAASVFGDVFWAGGVAALLGGEAPPGWDEGLAARELVAPQQESRFAGERQLCFRHALLREGAYATLVEGDRALGHQLAGEWLEAHGETDAMVLAQHFDLAGQGRRAGGFYLAAAAQALRAGDPDATIERVERALALDPGARVDGLALLCDAHGWRNDWGRCAVYARELLPLAPKGSVPWVRAISGRLTAAFLQNQMADYLEALEALAGVDPAPEAVAMVAGSLTTGVLLFCLVTQFEKALGMIARVDAVVDRTRQKIDPVARGWQGLCHAYRAMWIDGAPWAALAYARAARSSFAEVGDERHAHFAQIFVAMAAWSLGMIEEAEQDLRSLPLSGEDHLIGMLRTIYLVPVLAERGAFAEARQLAVERLTLAEAGKRVDDAIRAAEAHWLLGEIAHLTGDAEEAEREIARGIDVLQMFPLPWQAAAARLAQAKLALGKVDEALALSRRARESMRAHGGFGMRGMLVRLVHAEALEAAGQHAAARVELAEACDNLAARAARILDAATRQSYLTRVAENARVAALSEAWFQRA